MKQTDLERNDNLFLEIKNLIEQGRNQVAIAVNTTLSATYWNIGKLISDDILKNKRAEYGKKILNSLSEQLVKEYGNSFSVKEFKKNGPIL